MPLLLVTFCLLFGIIFGWLGYPSYLHAPFLGYSVFTLVTFLVLLFLRHWKTYFLFRFLIAMHFIGEVVCEMGIVYTSGSLYSSFSALFLLTIASAALAYRLVGTLVIASLVSAAYVFVTWMGAAVALPGGRVMSPGGSLFSADDALFYSVFLHILIFYLVAFVAGYLADKLQSKDRELSSASAELEKARLETGDILHHLNSGLLTVDRQGKVIYFNRAAELILAITAEVVSGRNCREVFTGRLAPLTEHLVSVLESRRHLSRAEIEIFGKNGEGIPIGISASLLFDAEDNVRGLIAIFQDITLAKRLEERFRQADRMAAIGELSAYIAHEIRNPLASISGSVELLKNDLVLDGDDARLMSLIVKETARLNKILSDFLFYARLGRTQFRKVELHRVISDTIDVVRRHPAYHDRIELTIRSPQNLVYISGDEDQIKQLLLNLTVNACEALGERAGRVEFDIADNASPNQVHLTVRDNGPGIQPDQLDKAFMPFYSTKKGGTGLGLAIVSRLMEAHEGSVEVESQPGIGTAFHLHFKKFADHSTERHKSPARSRVLT